MQQPSSLRILASRTLSVIHATPRTSLISSFLLLSRNDTPSIHRSILISVLSNSHQRCPDSWYRHHQRVSRCIEHLASFSTRILPPLSLITFVDCLSCLLLCLAFAILYILSSPSLVFSSWYICCNASPLAIATAFFVSLHIALYVIFSALSCRSFCQFTKAVFLSLTAVCTSSFHHQVSLSFLL